MNEPIERRTAVRRSLRERLRALWVSDRRGSVTVMVALTMIGLVSLLALGIDIGGLFNARSEAQRAADAAALAGASAFLEYEPTQARGEAESRAVELATANEIRNEQVVTEEVSVWVNVDSSTVRAQVRRDAVPTWFARLFGVESVDIAAEATAWAGESGAAQCVKPFAVPDLWEETNDDLNGNRLWDPGEQWSYDPSEGDRYVGYEGVGGATGETGYGSTWRNGTTDASGRQYNRDYGRRITIKVTNPHETFVPSFFLPWVLPEDAGQQSCGSTNPGGGGGGEGGGDGGPGNGGENGNGNGGEAGNGGNPFGWLKWWEKREDLGVSEPPAGGPDGDEGGSGGGSGRGAANYRQNICSCNRSIIDLDTEYEIEPGNMVGPTFQGMQSLIDLDPGAYWDDATNTIVSEYGMSSPRLVTVALFDPAEIGKPGRQNIQFNNFARVFIEEQASRQDPVTGRFLYYVPGVGLGRTKGKTTGSLVRVLQLIR